MKKVLPLLMALSPLFSSFTFGQSVTVSPYVSGLTYPIAIRHCGDDRLFVAQRQGQIRVINPDGTLRPTPFLDIADSISSINSEEGFLSFCFSPDYKISGKFYVSYTDSIGADLVSIVREYKVNAGDSNLADISSSVEILRIRQPYQNHNGGDLHFGPDGYLYVGFGDGGSGGDPENRAQNMDSLLGKMIRIDVSNSSSSQPYTIPADNPFATAGGTTRKEIWALGLRNPWRTSFDRITGDLWIADVGQNEREEIDFQPAGLDSGRNYGWRLMEGIACYNPPTNCVQPGLIWPIFDYDHTVGHSITGGYVYRSAQSRDLWGIYVFSDYTGDWIHGVRELDGHMQGNLITLLNSAGGDPIAFGEDRYGDLYICLNNVGTIYKIEDANPSPSPKAWFSTTYMGGAGTMLSALQGRNLNYQWLLNDAAIPGATNTDFTALSPGTYKLVVTNSLNNDDTSAAFLLSAVPVTLTNLRANRTGNYEIKISWTTTSEQNNKGFAIERKLDAASGFRQIAFLPSLAPGANYANELNYEYVDTVAISSAIQYRLKQVGLDGQQSYSEVVTVSPGNPSYHFRILPNPSKGQITILADGKEGDRYEFELLDTKGRILMKNVFTGRSHSLSTAGIPSGIYYLKLLNRTTMANTTEKVVIE